RAGSARGHRATPAAHPHRHRQGRRPDTGGRMSTTPDCRDLGLTPDQLACLTGFTRRAVAALAHLREAWCVADPGNAAAIETSLGALLASPSMRDIRPIALRVLGVGLDPGRHADLVDRVTAAGRPMAGV